MAKEMPSAEGKPRWTATSIALLAVGLLILVPSALCTAFFGFQLAIGGNVFASNADVTRAFLLFGCIAMTIGAGLIFGALEIRRGD